MKRTSFLVVLLMLVTCYGCKKPGCVGNAGPVVSQARLLEPFSELVLADNIDVELVQGNEEKMEITAPENILPNIQTIVTNQLLSITNESDCRWMRSPDEKIHIRLYFKDISRIDYRGSGNITNAGTLHLNILKLDSETGAGNIELTVDNEHTNVSIVKENATVILHGRSHYSGVYINARGKLDLNDFLIGSLTLIYSGLADTYIHVTDNLDATIRYKGNVYYKGNPAITRSDYFSSGQLIKLP